MSTQLQSRWLTTVSVGGRARQFQTFTGGNVTSEAVTTMPPTAEFPRASGGEKQLAPITVGVDYDSSIDDDQIAHFEKYVRKEDAVTVQRQRLDDDRNPAGRKTTWTGLITAVNQPDSDRNSTSDKSTWTVEIQPANKS